MKGGAYVINLYQFNDFGTHWVALYVTDNNVTYFESFGFEHIPKDIKRFIKDINIISNISRTQVYDLIIYGDFHIGCIGFTLNSKSLTDFISFLPKIIKK